MDLWKYSNAKLNMQSVKATNKHVNNDVNRHGVAYLRTCVSSVVMTYCRKSLMTYRFAGVLLCVNTVLLLYFSIDALPYIGIFVMKCRIIDVVSCRIIDAMSYRCDDVSKYVFIEAPTQSRKSMIKCRFTSFYQYLFTSLKICNNE
jgi:hypothetical protein